MMLLTTLISLPLLACTPTTPAGGFDRTQVDAGAKWVAHLDVEGFQASQLYQQLKAADKDGEMERGLAEIADESGLHLLEDVYSVTAYGTQVGKDHGVLIVQGSARLEALLAQVSEKEGGKALRLGAHDCMQWGKGEKPEAFSSLSLVTGSERRQVVLAKTQADLESALAVLDKQRPGLDSQTGSELYAAPAAGTFAFVAASGILEEMAGEHGHDVQQLSAAARLAKGLRLELGESSGSVFLDLRLRTEKPEDALKLKKIFDGLLAMAGLMHGEDEIGDVIDRLTQAVQSEALGEVAHLRFQYSAAALFAEVQALQQIETEMRAEHHTGKPKQPR